MDSTENKEYASKGIAGTALGLSIAGAYGLLANGDGVGGILGGGQRSAALTKELTDAKAEIAELKSKSYTDSAVLSTEKHLSTVDAQLHAVDDKLNVQIQKNREDILNLKEVIALQNENDRKQAKIELLELENKVDAKIDAVASTANVGIQANAGALSCLKNTVDNIYATFRLGIPYSSLCQPVPPPSGCCATAVQQ